MMAPKGVSPVIAVPFGDDGTLDLKGFARVAEHIAGSGARSSLLFGLASEFPKLTDDERDQLLATYVRVSRGTDLAIIASVTDHSADVAALRARRYAEAGASLVNVFPPHFLGPSRQQILDHIGIVAEAAHVPVVIQYAPNEAGRGISPADIGGLLGTHEGIVAVKVEATPPGAAIDELLASAPRRPSVLVGYAGLHWPEAAAHGADGVQPGCSFVELYSAAQAMLDAGRHDAFAALHARLKPWLGNWMTNVERIVAIEKLVLFKRGLIASPYCRRPFHALSNDDRAAVDRFLDEFGNVLMGAKRNERTA